MNRLLAVVLAAGALVFVSAAPSHARAAAGAHGFAGGQPAAHAAGHGGFQGHPAAAPRQHFVAGHQQFYRGGHGRVFVGVAPFFVGGPAYAYGWASAPVQPYEAPVYTAAPPSYWYYCPSAGGYYPDVPACPEPWVPVPSQ